MGKRGREGSVDSNDSTERPVKKILKQHSNELEENVVPAGTSSTDTPPFTAQSVNPPRGQSSIIPLLPQKDLSASTPERKPTCAFVKGDKSAAAAGDEITSSTPVDTLLKNFTDANDRNGNGNTSKASSTGPQTRAIAANTTSFENIGQATTQNYNDSIEIDEDDDDDDDLVRAADTSRKILPLRRKKVASKDPSKGNKTPVEENEGTVKKPKKRVSFPEDGAVGEDDSVEVLSATFNEAAPDLVLPEHVGTDTSTNAAIGLITDDNFENPTPKDETTGQSLVQQWAAATYSNYKPSSRDQSPTSSSSDLSEVNLPEMDTDDDLLAHMAKQEKIIFELKGRLENSLGVNKKQGDLIKYLQYAQKLRAVNQRNRDLLKEMKHVKGM